MAKNFQMVADRILGTEEDAAREADVQKHAANYKEDPALKAKSIFSGDGMAVAEDLYEDVAADSPEAGETSARLNKALELADEVNIHLQHWKKNADGTRAPDTAYKMWALKNIARFEAANPGETGDVDKKFEQVAKRNAQAEFLARWYNQNHGENLDQALERIASTVYGQHRGESNYFADRDPKIRGFFFETVSASVPIQSADVDVFYPDRGQPDKEAEMARVSLENAKIVTTSRLPRKADIIKDKVQAAVGSQQASLVRFDGGTRKWVATGAASPSTLERANKINDETNATLTVPDSIVVNGDRVVGFVEAKCWQEYEMAAFVDFLEKQQGAERYGNDIGSQISADEINAYRLAAGMDVIDLPKEGLNLRLKLTAERNYVAAATGIKSDKETRNLIAVLRLPAGISPELIGRLRAQLEGRGERVVIEQIKALTADETEIVATSLIDLEFAKREAERFAAAKNKDYNLKARAVALGVTSLEGLTKPAVTSILNEAKSAVENELDEGFTTRGALVTQLKKDYEAARNLRH